MILDIIFLLILIFVFRNGYKKGIISSVLSFVAIFVGIVLAINFSSVAGIWLTKSLNIPSAILPILSFVFVVVVVVAAIKIVAMIMEKFLSTISLNFVNKLAGGTMWTIIAALLFSVGLTLLGHLNVFTPSFEESSYTFKYIVPFGPMAIDFVGTMIPFLGEAFRAMNETMQELAGGQ